MLSRTEFGNELPMRFAPTRHSPQPDLRSSQGRGCHCLGILDLNLLLCDDVASVLMRQLRLERKQRRLVNFNGISKGVARVSVLRFKAASGFFCADCLRIHAPSARRFRDVELSPKP